MSRKSRDINIHSWLGHLYHMERNIRHYRDCDICALGQTERSETAGSVREDVQFHIEARKSGKRTVEF